MPQNEISVRGNRKDDHVRLALAQAREGARESDFDSVQFVHHALNAVDLHEVSIATKIGALQLQSPLLINAMTGGSAKTLEINQKLARVAKQTGAALATGSINAALKDPSVERSFAVIREEHPDGIILANLGAGATAEEALRAVDLVQANALQIHLNSVQEIVMAEGDRRFSHWERRLGQILEAVRVPVVLKEVGFGISVETAERLISLGVETIDVSGRGGTNFARIENARRPDQDFRELNEWGLSTAESLLDVYDLSHRHRVNVIASGGIRSAMDVTKAMAMGAQAVGIAGGFLATLETGSEEALAEQILSWNEKIRAIMAILGAPTIIDLSRTDLLLYGDVREFCLNRGIDPRALAGRSGARRVNETKKNGAGQ